MLSAEPYNVGIRQEITDAVADKNVVETFLCHQLGYRLAVLAQIHQHHLTIGFCQKTAKTVGIGVSNDQ